MRFYPIENALKRLLPPKGWVVQERFPDGCAIKFYHDPLNDVSKEIFWTGSYEPATARFLAQRIKSASKAFIDIGANIGYFSILCAQMNPALRVTAFEPLARNVEQLKKNIRLNGVGDRVSVIHAAVGDRDGQATLYRSAAASCSETSLLQSFRNGRAVEQCRQISLDSLKRQGILTRAELIKIDVEGAEAQVFEGMREILREWEPDLICEVLPGRLSPEISELLRDLGYAFFWIGPEVLRPMTELLGDSTYQCNNYFLTKK